jgi:hypothetical protein
VLVKVSGEKDFFANMVVEAVSKLDPATLDLRLIGMKKVRRLCKVRVPKAIFVAVYTALGFA